MRYYVFVLQSYKDNNFYVGYTVNLKQKLEEHNSGKLFSTKSRKPMKLVYYGFCLNQIDTKEREKYLKIAWGKRYIKNKIKIISRGDNERIANY